MDPWGWSQLGLAGTIAVSLGGVIAYVFKLFINTQTDAIARSTAARDEEHNENIALQARLDDQQRSVLTTLADVARVMSEVQQMLREREIQLAMEREFERRKGQQHDGSGQ